jgi:hypothetical protein
MTTADDVLPTFAEFFIDVFHQLHCAIHVAQEVSDWQSKFQDALKNPLLIDKTDRVAALSREIVEHALVHRENIEDFHARLEQLRKALHERIH